jgi:hypothetical protein
VVIARSRKFLCAAAPGAAPPGLSCALGFLARVIKMQSSGETHREDANSYRRRPGLRRAAVEQRDVKNALQKSEQFDSISEPARVHILHPRLIAEIVTPSFARLESEIAEETNNNDNALFPDPRRAGCLDLRVDQAAA